MTFDILMGGALVLVLLVYFLCALLAPEWF